MNENSQLLGVLSAAIGQLNAAKESIDPAAYDLLAAAAREAIASAHHFLDACEVVLDSLVRQEESADPVADEKSDNVVPLAQ